MIVVAPHQGGLPEIIEHEVNGFLVPNTEDVEPYVEAILKVKNNRNLKNTFYEVTRTKLQQQHSQAAFLSNVLRELK
jgi:glycosyltransferase involved in cell wall biosynthesis